MAMQLVLDLITKDANRRNGEELYALTCPPWATVKRLDNIKTIVGRYKKREFHSDKAPGGIGNALSVSSGPNGNPALQVNDTSHLYNLALAFKTGSLQKKYGIKQNLNKYAICLALIVFHQHQQSPNRFDPKYLNELKVHFAKDQTTTKAIEARLTDLQQAAMPGREPGGTGAGPSEMKSPRAGSQLSLTAASDAAPSALMQPPPKPLTSGGVGASHAAPVSPSGSEKKGSLRGKGLQILEGSAAAHLLSDFDTVAASGSQASGDRGLQRLGSTPRPASFPAGGVLTMPPSLASSSGTQPGQPKERDPHNTPIVPLTPPRRASAPPSTGRAASSPTLPGTAGVGGSGGAQLTGSPPRSSTPAPASVPAPAPASSSSASATTLQAATGGDAIPDSKAPFQAPLLAAAVAAAPSSTSRPGTSNPPPSSQPAAAPATGPGPGEAKAMVFRDFATIYRQQEKERQWKTGLAIALAVIFSPTLVVPALSYYFWRKGKRNELVQKIEMTEAEFKSLEQYAQGLRIAEVSNESKIAPLQTTPPKKPGGKATYWLEKERANRLRALEDRRQSEQPFKARLAHFLWNKPLVPVAAKPLTPEEKEKIRLSKEASVRLSPQLQVRR